MRVDVAGFPGQQRHRGVGHLPGRGLAAERQGTGGAARIEPRCERPWLTAGTGCGHARWVDERVIVIGAGPAGLAAAWAIGRAGVDPLVVVRAGAVAASWRGRHDQLRLNTHRMLSHQPGARIPRRYRPFPARDDYVAHLERYAPSRRRGPAPPAARPGHGEMAASAAPVISPRAGADPGQIFMTMHGPSRL